MHVEYIESWQNANFMVTRLKCVIYQKRHHVKSQSWTEFINFELKSVATILDSNHVHIWESKGGGVHVLISLGIMPQMKSDVPIRIWGCARNTHVASKNIIVKKWCSCFLSCIWKLYKFTWKMIRIKLKNTVSQSLWDISNLKFGIISQNMWKMLKISNLLNVPIKVNFRGLQGSSLIYLVLVIIMFFSFNTESGTWKALGLFLSSPPQCFLLSIDCIMYFCIL